MGALDGVPQAFLRNFHRYKVQSLLLERDGDRESWIVAVRLEHEGEVLTLRFEGVRGFAVEEGFPDRSSGLVLHDVSDRGMDGIRVSVDSSGAAPAVKFHAARVSGNYER